jgi:signal transduction histidine kinase
MIRASPTRHGQQRFGNVGRIQRLLDRAARRRQWFLFALPLYALVVKGPAAWPLAAAMTAAAALYTVATHRAERRHGSVGREILFRCADIALIGVGLILIGDAGLYSHLYQAAIYLVFVVLAAASTGRRGLAWVATTAALAIAAGQWAIALYGPAMRPDGDYWVAATLFPVTAWLLYLTVGLLPLNAGERGDDRPVRGRSSTRQHPRNGGRMETAPATSDLSFHRRIAEIEAHRERLASMGEITAHVVHALSGSLTGIMTVVDGLLEDCNEGDRRSLELVRNEAARASSIVREVLHFARRDVSRPVISLNDAVERAINLFALADPADPVELRRDLTDRPTPVRAAPSQLEQVVLNLLENARHAINGRQPGEITVRTAVNGHKVTLEVSDNGSGIPPEIRERIFEPFFTTKEPGVGTGLGLAIVATVIRDCRGEIAVDSTPGKGTTFTISFEKSSPIDSIG